MKNTILATYEDKTRQMLAIKKPTKETVDILHRTLHPTKSNKFITIELDCGDLDKILNNSLAKPYSIDLSYGNVIVSETQIQFIVESEVNYISIDLPATTKIRNFLFQILNNLLSFDIGSRSCNHRDTDGSLNIEQKNPEGSSAECKICGETFNILVKEDVKEVEKATDLLFDAINTIKILNPEYTKAQLIELSSIMSNIYNIPVLLEEAVSKLDNI